jgi:hypothetical protein
MENIENNKDTYLYDKENQRTLNKEENEEGGDDNLRKKSDLNNSFNSKLQFCPSEILSLQMEKLKQRKLSKSLANKELDNFIFNLDYNQINSLENLLPPQNGSTNFFFDNDNNINYNNNILNSQELKNYSNLDKISPKNFNQNGNKNDIYDKENKEDLQNLIYIREKEKLIELNKNNLKSLESILDENCDLISNYPLNTDDDQTEEKEKEKEIQYNNCKNQNNFNEIDNVNNDKIEINSDIWKRNSQNNKIIILDSQEQEHEDEIKQDNLMENYRMEEISTKKGVVLFQSVQQRKNYEEKISVLNTRIKKLREQEDELNKKLAIEKKKIMKSEQIRNGVLENKKRIELEKEQRQIEKEKLKQNILLEKEIRQNKINEAKILMQKEKIQKFKIVKQDKILVNSLKQTLQSQTNNIKNYQYFKNKQEEITMKVKRFQKCKEKEEELKNKFDSKIEKENKKAFELKLKLEKLEEQELEYLKRVENTLMRNTLEIDNLKNKNRSSINTQNPNLSFTENRSKGNFYSTSISASAGNTKLSTPIGTPKNSQLFKYNFASCPIKLETIYDGENEENEYLASQSNKKEKEPHNNKINKNISKITRTISQKFNVISNDNCNKNLKDKNLNEQNQVNGAEKKQIRKCDTVAKYDISKIYIQNNYLTQGNTVSNKKSIKHTSNTNAMVDKISINNINTKGKNKIKERPEWKNLVIKNRDINSNLSIKIGSEKDYNVCRKIDFSNNTHNTLKNI